MVYHEQLSNFLLRSFDAKSLQGCVVVRDNALVRSDPYQRTLHGGRGFFEEESTHSRSTASVSLHSLPSLSSDGSVSRWDSSCGSRLPASNNGQQSPSQSKPRVPHRTDSSEDKDFGSLVLQHPRNRRRASISSGTSIASSSTEEESRRPLRRPTRRRSIDVSEPGEPSIVVRVPIVRRAPLRRRNSVDNHPAWIHNASSSSRSSSNSHNASSSSHSSDGDSVSKLHGPYHHNHHHHRSAPSFHLPSASLQQSSQSSNHARHQRSILNTMDLFPQQQQSSTSNNEENEHSDSTNADVPVVVVQTQSQ